jgi:pantoate--beta-alanine ligase
MLQDIGVESVFCPTESDMYSRHFCCHVEPRGFELVAEGKARAEFFRGVATIVSKLFNVVDPDVAYFGQKDAAQCVLIHRLVQDLNFSVEVRVHPTVRAPDGLALSSRNAYLTPEERQHAPILYKALAAAAQATIAAEVPSETVRTEALRVLSTDPLVRRVEYVSVASVENMAELDHVLPAEGAIISAAVRLGNTRLIDNVIVGPAAKRLGLLHQAHQAH